MEVTRRDFIGTAALAAGGMLGGCATGGASAQTPPFTWGTLLHLGSNMWDDYITGPDDWAKSAEEEKLRPNPYGPSGRRRSGYRCYLRSHDDLWRKAVDHAADEGLPITNYGIAIAMMHGILKRSRSPFPQLAKLLA